MPITREIVYKTSDGRTHSDKATAEAIQKEIDCKDEVMELYEKELGVGQSTRSLNFQGGIMMLIGSNPVGLRDILSKHIRRMPKKQPVLKG
tara:strand:- start:11574 stop:11846 length:273 start_codon:yes stop_codon:yes gene_type:complete